MLVSLFAELLTVLLSVIREITGVHKKRTGSLLVPRPRVTKIVFGPLRYSPSISLSFAKVLENNAPINGSFTCPPWVCPENAIEASLGISLKTSGAIGI